MTSKDETWAVFWCGLLCPILYGEITPKEENRFLRELSGKELVYPDGKRRRPSLSTLRRKLRAYRREGFKALARRKRSDRGKSRKVSPEIIEKAVALKREQPRRSDETINNILESSCLWTNSIVHYRPGFRSVTTRGNTPRRTRRRRSDTSRALPRSVTWI